MIWQEVRRLFCDEPARAKRTALRRITSAVILGMIVALYPARGEQVRAIGVISFVAAAGGAAGPARQGQRHRGLDWHWIFSAYHWCAANDDVPELLTLARTISTWETELVRAVLTGASAVWRHLSPGSPLGAFTRSDPIRLLAHNLDFWVPPVTAVMEEILRGFPVVSEQTGEQSVSLVDGTILDGAVAASRPRLSGDWHDGARMSEQETGKRIPSDGQVAVELLLAVRAGDVAAIQRLLRNDPALASARLFGKDGGAGTPLHLVTDWPGYFPNGPEIVRLLIDAGADPSALTSGRDSPGPGDETPLHYAASSDDVDVAEALIEGGANIETPDGSIGTPLDNAVGYGCWHVARLLVARGARVDKAWHAAALGMLGRLAALLGSDPTAEDVSQAFWHTCTGGQRRAAEYLLSRGADLNWEPDYAHGTPLDAASGLGTRQENVISWLRELGARSSSSE